MARYGRGHPIQPARTERRLVVAAGDGVIGVSTTAIPLSVVAEVVVPIVANLNVPLGLLESSDVDVPVEGDTSGSLGLQLIAEVSLDIAVESSTVLPLGVTADASVIGPVTVDSTTPLPLALNANGVAEQEVSAVGGGGGATVGRVPSRQLLVTPRVLRPVHASAVLSLPLRVYGVGTVKNRGHAQARLGLSVQAHTTWNDDALVNEVLELISL